MAKAKPAKKSAAPLLSKPKKGERSYTRSKLVAHLAAAVSAKGLGDITKKQSAALVEELGTIILAYAPVGALVPGLGKVTLREKKAVPAGTKIMFGKEVQTKAKPKSWKLKFNFNKEAKDALSK
jgi:hypothetical protein